MTVNLRRGEIWIIKIYFNECTSIFNGRSHDAYEGCLLSHMHSHWHHRRRFIWTNQSCFRLAKKMRHVSWLSLSHTFVFDEVDLRSAWIWWKLMSDHLYLFCSRSATGNGHSSKSKRRQNEAAGERMVCCLFFIALEMNDSRNCRAAKKRINNLYQFASVDRRKRSSDSSWLFFFSSIKCQNKLRCWIIWRFFVPCGRRRRLRHYKMPLL